VKPQPADLALDTAVRRLDVAPGWYTADLGHNWDFESPSGGVLMTIAMRAMVAELGDPALRPVSATTLFCSPVPAGPLEIRVQVLRKGGAAAQLRAELSSTTLPGPGLEVSATFARERQGPHVQPATPPALPGVDSAAVIEEIGRAGKRWPFFGNFDMRLAHGPRFWEPGWQQGDARFARWFRYRMPQREGAIFDLLALPPIADTMPPSMASYLGPETRYFFPSLDLTVHFLEDTTSEWLLCSAYSRQARRGVATAEMEIWSDQGRLVAYANQMMFMRKEK
jgi:acyl-CoA thioesterase